MTACGFACWEAREDVCRCSCGGRNHGISRKPSCAAVAKPARQMVWENYLWQLDRVAKPVLWAEDQTGGLAGNGVMADGGKLHRPERLDVIARDLNTAKGVSFYGAATARKFWNAADFPHAITRTATPAQIKSWPELAAWRDPTISPHSFAFDRPALLWTRQDKETALVREALAKGQGQDVTTLATMGTPCRETMLAP